VGVLTPLADEAFLVMASGSLLIGTTNVLTALGEKATHAAALDLKAPKESPIFSGTATAADLTVSGTLRVGTTNVLSTLNLKANASDVYTRAQIETNMQPRIASFDAPLKYTENLLTGINSLSIDSTVPFPIGNIECSGTLSIDTIEARFAYHIHFDNNLTVSGNIQTIGNLDITGEINFKSIKPWIGLLVNTSGAITVNVGQVPTSEITVSLSNNIFTITYTPHPLGTLGFLYFAQATGSTIFSATTTTNTATNIKIYIKSAAKFNIGGNLYVTLCREIVDISIVKIKT
jgi:hypothetical protein